jgi:hypothetical protein
MNTGYRILTLDVFLAKNITRDAVNDSERHSLPVGILGASQKGFFAPIGMEAGHSCTDKQNGKDHNDCQSLRAHILVFHSTVLLAIKSAVHSISDTTNSP